MNKMATQFKYQQIKFYIIYLALDTHHYFIEENLCH